MTAKEVNRLLTDEMLRLKEQFSWDKFIQENNLIEKEVVDWDNLREWDYTYPCYHELYTQDGEYVTTAYESRMY